LFNSRDFRRNLQCAVAGLAILAATWVSAAGQAPSDIVPHSSPAEVAEGIELNKGAEAYRGARYDEAIVHFQKATELAPDEPIARLYLATALSQNVVPGLDTPENLRLAQQAIDNFQWVLSKKPHDVNSMKQVAGVYYSIKKLDDARTWQKKVLDEDPKDTDAAYTIGVIDWTQAHQNVLEALTRAGLTDDGAGNATAPAAVMEAIKAKNGDLVEEAMHYLSLAVQMRANYDDAMAYLNLIYRRKADLDWNDQEAREDDVASAVAWTQKAMEARKVNAEKSRAGADSKQP
jgi:tetratricopeptide (TPR) repeat protein